MRRTGSVSGVSKKVETVGHICDLLFQSGRYLTAQDTLNRMACEVDGEPNELAAQAQEVVFELLRRAKNVFPGNGFRVERSYRAAAVGVLIGWYACEFLRSVLESSGKTKRGSV